MVGIIEQFRVGALGQSSNPWQFEIVAGMVEKNEILENVAIREVQEETGLTLSDIQPILSYLPSAGASNERMHLFCGSARSFFTGSNWNALVYLMLYKLRFRSLIDDEVLNL